MLTTHPLNLQDRLGPLAQAFQGQAFRHCAIDDILPPELALACREALPNVNDASWHLYHSPLEHKQSQRCLDKAFPPALDQVLTALNSETFVAQLRTITGIPDLMAAPDRFCSELHCSRQGGFLGIHTDANVHPQDYALQRRLVAVLYLSPDWQPAYGGNLELWNSDLSACIDRIETRFNRLVLFANDEDAHHGHPEPLAGPADFVRYSITIGYFTHAPTPINVPRKAQFKPRPWERGDGFEALRQDRMRLRTSS